MDVFFELDIPAGLNTIESHFFVVRDVPTFSQSLLSSNGLDAESIGFINGVTANMETRFSGLDLDFIENIGVQIISGDGLEDRREAFFVFSDFVQLGSKTEIAMIPSLLDLKDQLLEETVDIEFKINFRAFLPQQIDARVNMKFHAFPPE